MLESSCQVEHEHVANECCHVAKHDLQQCGTAAEDKVKWVLFGDL